MGSKKRQTFVLVSLAVLLLLLGGCTGNTRQKELYEQYDWGTTYTTICEEFDKAGLNYDYTWSVRCLDYQIPDFLGVAGVEAGVTHHFDKEDGLESTDIILYPLSYFSTSSTKLTNEQINSLMDTLKEHYGEPNEESDSNTIGYRFISMKWQTENSIIKFSSIGGLPVIHIDPKEN